MFNQLIALLFYSREYAHRAHLAASSHSRHVILDEFYKGIVDKIDTLAEVYQGRFGKLVIPYFRASDDIANPTMVLQQHVELIEQLRCAEPVGDYSPIQNVVDEILAFYLRTIYKLKDLP